MKPCIIGWLHELYLHLVIHVAKDFFFPPKKKKYEGLVYSIDRAYQFLQNQKKEEALLSQVTSSK